MNCTYDFYSEIGGRQENQDSVLATEIGSGQLFVVADGLGGHNGGATASAMAIKTMETYLRTVPIAPDSLSLAISAANTEIVKNQVAQLRDMKTTVAAVYLDDTAVYLANVGDSRIYAFADGEIVFQSTDHSATHLAVMLGEITKDEMRTHPDRNRLTRALGASATVKVECYTLPLGGFDALLLCSDGFWEDVVEADMSAFLRATPTPSEWLRKMCTKVEQTPHHDNNTAICAFVGAPAPVDAPCADIPPPAPDCAEQPRKKRRIMDLLKKRWSKQ